MKGWQAERAADATAGVHAAVMEFGWAIVDQAMLGLDAGAVILNWDPRATLDPRAPTKRHARDVIIYERTEGNEVQCTEAESIAHRTAGGEIVDDFSRVRWLDQPGGRAQAATLLRLVPPDLARPAGMASADYFYYSPGTESTQHQDQFGDVVVIWCLGEVGMRGGNSYLIKPTGFRPLDRPLRPGEILIFRDELFLHGFSKLYEGERAALILITWKAQLQ